MAGPKGVFVKLTHPELTAALEATEAELEQLRTNAQDLAISIGTNLVWQMYRDVFSGATPGPRSPRHRLSRSTCASVLERVPATSAGFESLDEVLMSQRGSPGE